MQNTRIILVAVTIVLATVPLMANEKAEEAPVMSPSEYPQLGGKGPGMGHDYQKNTPGPGMGKPNYQGGQTDHAEIESASADGSNTGNQLDKPTAETQQEAIKVKDQPANKINEEQINLNSGSQTIAPVKRQRGSGVGFPGNRGQGGSGYPQHRQFGSPPMYPAADQAKQSTQLKSKANDIGASPQNQSAKNAIASASIDKRRELLHAAGFGDIAAANKLLKEGANPNARAKDRTSRTALILAAAGGHLDIVDALLAKGAKINERDLTGHTALNWAAMRGHIKTVSLLLNKGADINTRDNGDVTPLLYAVGTQNPAMVKLLANKGADLEALSRENKMTPLLLAIEHKNLEILKILIDKGVKTDKKSLEMINQIKSKRSK